MKPAQSVVGPLVGFFAWFCLSAPGCLALTETQCVDIIQKSKVLSPDAKVQARVGNNQVALSAYRNPKATDKDCKIDSVLVAKAIMDVDPKGVTEVCMRFYDPTNRMSYREVRVSATIVKAFGQRRLSQDELLSSVSIVTGQQEITKYRNQSYGDFRKSSDVVDGEYRGERLRLLGELQVLRERGVGVESYMGEFYKIEDSVRRGDDDAARQGLHELSQKVHDLEVEYGKAHNMPAHHMPLYSKSGRMPPPGAPGGPAVSPQGESPVDAMRRELGEDAPVDGPLLQERYNVIRRINELKATGVDVGPYRSLYRELQYLAGSGRVKLLRMRLRYTMHQLGIPAMIQD